MVEWIVKGGGAHSLWRLTVELDRSVLQLAQKRVEDTVMVGWNGAGEGKNTGEWEAFEVIQSIDNSIPQRKQKQQSGQSLIGAALIFRQEN